MKTSFLFIFLFCMMGCDKESGTTNQEPPAVKDSVIAVPTRFIAVDYIELDKIERISKFRSGIGHDYHDDAESCRSMKHYYQPKIGISWASVKIFSPVNGTVVRLFDEWAGTQVQIRPKVGPDFTIIIFHITLRQPLSVGDSVLAGQQLGTHIGSQTMSDNAIGYSGLGTWKLLSYFDVMSDSLFQRYTERGISSRTMGNRIGSACPSR